MNKQYTVKEIDELIKACELRWLYGTTNTDHIHCSRAYSEIEKCKCTGELVRTYMLSGITAKDIYEADI